MEAYYSIIETSDDLVNQSPADERLSNFLSFASYWEVLTGVTTAITLRMS